jgi:hypothetical protein
MWESMPDSRSACGMRRRNQDHRVLVVRLYFLWGRVALGIVCGGGREVGLWVLGEVGEERSSGV